MLPKSVSPRFVPLAAAILAAIPCVLFAYVPINLIHLGENPSFQLRFWLIYILSLFFVVPKVLSCLGIRIRSRSVERFQAEDRDDGHAGSVELPIRIVRGQRLISMVSAAFYLAGLVFLLAAWFLLPRGHRDAWMNTVAMLSLAAFLMIVGFLVRRARPVVICEVNEKGIRAPDGFWGRQTWVPWADVTRCEIIRDDGTWCDHFLLWDREGRRRFKSSRDWMGRVRRSERTRIFRALRARFPLKAKPDGGAEPAMAGVTSSAVWDREFDG
jgi:hypothetical protein